MSEAEIKIIQEQIKRLTAQSQSPSPSPSSSSNLPPVPMMPNLARGSAEMWQYYQYQRKIYDQLQELPSEIEFLTKTIADAADLKAKLTERLDMLNRRASTSQPVLLQPITSVRPLSYQEKVERAKLIAQHLARADYDPVKIVEQIKQLQNRLMDLEEQMLDTLL